MVKTFNIRPTQYDLYCTYAKQTTKSTKIEQYTPCYKTREARTQGERGTTHQEKSLKRKVYHHGWKQEVRAE